MGRGQVVGRAVLALELRHRSKSVSVRARRLLRVYVHEGFVQPFFLLWLRCCHAGPSSPPRLNLHPLQWGAQSLNPLTTGEVPVTVFLASG